jgi:hypothetical protein
MSLKSLIDNANTDKNTTHSYLDLYESLLSRMKTTATKVLEVGIGDFGPKNGGSIKLWRDYFPNAQIYGLDILSEDRVIDELKTDPRVVLYTSTNAYDEEFFKSNILASGDKFNFMLDDGPHTLDSMLQFIKLYHQVMSDDGILIIEDIQSMDWIDSLKQQVPDNLKQYINVYDLRSNKGRYDDIVFTVDKKH